MAHQVVKDKKNIKISFVVLDLVPQGGVRVIIDIANMLSKYGYEVHIYTSRKPSLSPFLILPTVSVHYALKTQNKIVAYLFFPVVLPFILSGNLFISTFYYVRLPTKLSAYLRRATHCYFIQGIECFRKGLMSKPLNLLCKTALNERNLLASNRYLSNAVEKIVGRNIAYIGLGPSKIFFDQPRVERLKKFDIIYFARRETFKRLDLFLDLFSNATFIKENWKIVIVTQDRMLAKELTNMSLQGCKIMTPLDDKELVSIIDQSKLMFFTSDYEGLGLPPLECMLREVPVVTYKTYPLTEYFDKNELQTLLIDDTVSAVETMSKLLSPDGTYVKFGTLCKEFVYSEFSNDYANDFSKHVSSLVSKRM
jgi:glycosyltransferase involved in cell wall biosynthesis